MSIGHPLTSILNRIKWIYSSISNRSCILLVENNIVTVAIQVCYTFYAERTRKREVDGLLEAMETFNLTSGLIITNDVEDNITVDDKHIDIIPAWKWLLA